MTTDSTLGTGSGTPGTAPIGTGIVLAKIRPSEGLLAASRTTELEPLYPDVEGPGAFAIDAGPQWFRVRLEEDASPWDQAHNRVAGRLGIDASDVVFAEPDLIHSIFPDDDAEGSLTNDLENGFGLGERCEPIEQESGRGKPVGSGFAWHLGNDFSQLERAREDVRFDAPRTRIAHLDTGYYPEHETTPTNILRRLERNFVDGEDSTDASDPDRDRLLLDNSGHGTGTIGILAGGRVSAFDDVLGGAPEADVVPIRVADSVILLRTSALARALRYAVEARCAVATLSMGGLPSKAWAEAVDHAYLAGLCLCAAGGNRKGVSPPKTLVYPARYDRVIAVTGVMADERPYRDLDGGALEGSFGPTSAMTTAIAAYTPNIPWPKYGCAEIARLNGEGTSAATPQVAAAAALWIEKHKTVLRADWRRVEAVRHALFSTAKRKSGKEFFGNGILQAARALDVAPDLRRKQAGRSRHSWAFLRLLTGLGIDEITPREEMFNLELAQLWLLDDALQEIAPDPEATTELEPKSLEALMELIIENDRASQALRSHMVSRYGVVTGKRLRRTGAVKEMIKSVPDVSVEEPEVPDPPSRRLRAYAKDPSLSSQLGTFDVGEVTLNVRWEKLTTRKYGFVGEYLEVDDRKDRSSGYSGVDLDDPRLLATDGWPPSEGNPQFHQQMAYGVAMNTIEHFERALGRPVQWRPRPNPDNPFDDSQFVQQLTVHPHALQTANAYYSPTEVALKFGFYPAPAGGHQIPGSPVYTCLAHDIVVHETTHAILDGMYRRFNQPSNPDVLALHEGFADIVALLQQFANADLLNQAIARSQGDLEAETVLGQLAIQLGETTRGRSALRSAIGTTVDGEWRRTAPDPTALATTTTPHARGAILVGAVFDALLAIYRIRTADLLRIATGGTGRLPEGAIHPDLAHRLATEAAKAARQVLDMCIRALDFLPPVDVTFFDYLRALVTADFEVESNDTYGYRVAFVEAFARRGIFPSSHDEQVLEGPRALSADTLRWPSFQLDQVPADQRENIQECYDAIARTLRTYADDCMYVADRKVLFDKARSHRAALHEMLEHIFANVPGFAASLGLAEGGFEVHTLRQALRARPDGRFAPQVIATLTQSVAIKDDDGKDTGRRFHGGSTLVVDLTSPQLLKYRIVKHIDDEGRRQAAMGFAAHIDADPLRRLFLSAAEPFAALHQIVDDG
jgi:hypothetical protein